MKQNIVYKCSNCGYESIKWLGRCPECQMWNVFFEEVKTEGKYIILSVEEKPSKVYKLKDIEALEKERIKTEINELDRILGGGIIEGMFVLIGGPPGIGKSTLMMQVADMLAKKNIKVLYVSGEESIPQLKNRAKRLNLDSEEFYLVYETDLSRIIQHINSISPDVLVIDSIQTIYKPDIPSTPGTVTQIRESAQELLYLAKSNSLPTFLLGHVTKTGEIAGPKILEHMVDTVLYFESERQYPYRILRVEKNRYGPAYEVGLFEMKSDGLKEITNPSVYFISERGKAPGSTIISTIEGTRPILLEVQALISKTNYPYPRRVFTGIDFNKGVILISILEKRLNLPLQNYDIFINVVGGIKINEPAADLGVCMAIVSAFYDYVIPEDTLFLGEVGLASEIRGIAHSFERILEAEKIGLKTVILPKINLKELTLYKGGLTLKSISTLQEAVDMFIKKPFNCK